MTSNTFKRKRLSTISSDQNLKDLSQIHDLPQAIPSERELERRRRESSYTEALDDPLRYMDLVQKMLGQHDEEEAQKVQKKVD